MYKPNKVQSIDWLEEHTPLMAEKLTFQPSMLAVQYFFRPIRHSNALIYTLLPMLHLPVILRGR